MDKTVEFEDLSIRGVSISPCYDMPGLAKTWDYMTLDHAVERAAFEFSKVDVIVSHCPPYGYLDQLTAHSPHIGSRELTACIVRQQPKLVVCGHVHESQGEHIIGETLVVNVARTWRIVDL
jgi:Icc-related predicted phosphoesterase